MRLRLQGIARPPDWMRELATIVEARADVVLWDPRAEKPRGTTLAFLDAAEDPYRLVHSEALASAHVVADAFAGDRAGVRAALDWLAAGAPRPGAGGVFLGGLGTESCAVAAGTAVPIAPRCLVGRAPTCDLVLRQGAHSDQNLCGRRHATVERTPDGILVSDLGSTNGTFVGGRSVTAPTRAAPGEHVTFAVFRLAICG